MPTEVGKILRAALASLESERARMDRQITALQRAVGAGRDSAGPAKRARTRTPLGIAARRAISRRMKAYWAKRRGKKAEAKRA